MDYFNIEVSFPLEGPSLSTGRISHFARSVDTKVLCPFPQGENFLGIFINLGKDQKYSVGPTRQGTFPKYYSNLLYVPEEAYIFHLERGHYSWICLHYTPDYLEGLAEGLPQLQAFLEKNHYGTPLALDAEPIPAPYQALDIIHDMMQSRLRGTARDLDLYMKSTGILTSCLLQSDKKLKKYISENDVAKLNWVHQYISENLQYAHTTSVLALKAGMSEKNFKQYFQTLFGNAVQNVIMDIRMKKAKQLLRETKLTAKEIAPLVGYDYMQTFVAAFKREIGCSPETYRMMNGKLEGS